MTSKVLRRLRGLIRWAKTTLDMDDTGDFPVHQTTYMGKVGDAVAWFPYGFHANIPAEELALIFALQGNPEARVSLPGSPTKRIKVATGEVVVFHPSSGSKIHFKADGTIEITAPLTKVIGNFEVTGDSALGATVTSDGTDISNTHTHAGSSTAPTGAISDTGVPV